jgi:hypothetical protein
VSTDDPVENKLLRSHEAEADKQGAEFWNYGKGTAENEIYSKKSKGHLVSCINPNTMEVRHQWTTFDEKARNDEQFSKGRPRTFRGRSAEVRTAEIKTAARGL